MITSCQQLQGLGTRTRTSYKLCRDSREVIVSKEISQKKAHKG